MLILPVIIVNKIFVNLIIVIFEDIVSIYNVYIYVYIHTYLFIIIVIILKISPVFKLGFT